MKRTRKVKEPGAVLPHRVECAAQAACHAAAAMMQISAYVIDLQRPNLPPDLNRIDVAMDELKQAAAWLASAEEP